MSESTKSVIALAFKNVAKNKCIDKITVQDITDECGINRQSFYYHFQDRNDLLKWIFHAEVFIPVLEILSSNNIYETFLLMFENINKEFEFYYNAISIKCDNCFKIYLYSILKNLVVTISEQKIDSVEVGFCASGLLGLITLWLRKELTCSYQDLANQTTKIISKLITETSK